MSVMRSIRLLLIAVMAPVWLAGCGSNAATPATAAPTEDQNVLNARATVNFALSVTPANGISPTAMPTMAPAVPATPVLSPTPGGDSERPSPSPPATPSPTIEPTATPRPPATHTPTPQPTATPIPTAAEMPVPASTATPNLAATQSAQMDALMKSAVEATLAAQGTATAMQMKLETAVAAALTAQAPPPPPPTATPTMTPRPTATQTPSAAIEPLRLAFVRGDIGKTDIRVLTVDTGELKTVADRSCDEAEPSWAPDGRTIVYQADCDGTYDLHLVNVVTGAHRQLTSSRDLQERDADISPDGNYIAYRINQDHEGRNVDAGLWIMDIDGANARPIGIDGRSPAWSPNREQLLFMSERTGRWEIYLYDLNSSATTQLTSCPGDCRFPVWSPDGKEIAYFSVVNPDFKENASIMVQNVATGGTRTLVTGNYVGRPSWSEAGLVAFNSGGGLEVINQDGSNRQLIIPDDTHWAPTWSR